MSLYRLYSARVLLRHVSFRCHVCAALMTVRPRTTVDWSDLCPLRLTRRPAARRLTVRTTGRETEAQVLVEKPQGELAGPRETGSPAA